MGFDSIKVAPAQIGLRALRSYLLLFSLFFLIAQGLGYPTLNRFHAPSVPGLSDSAIYYQLVVGPPSVLARPYMRCRVLIPLVAKPFYHFARRFIPTIDGIAFGLLVSNSLFVGLGACFLVSIGNQISGEPAVAILGATLYLLSFAIPNLQLAGLVDSGEACFMLAVTWSLLTQRWWLLPIWGILGALAKETFVPFAIVFTLAWWFSEGRKRNAGGMSQWKWIALLVIAGAATMTILHSVIEGQMIWPWDIAAEARAGAPLHTALIGSISDRSFWYVFIWLLPLGLLGVRQIPKPWLVASLATASSRWRWAHGKTCWAPSLALCSM